MTFSDGRKEELMFQEGKRIKVDKDKTNSPLNIPNVSGRIIFKYN